MGGGDLPFQARFLRALRLRGVRQTDIAQRLGITQSAVSKWVRGRSTPDIPTLRQLAAILNVTVDYLVGGDDSKDLEAIAKIVEGLQGVYELLGSTLNELELYAATPAPVYPFDEPEPLTVQESSNYNRHKG